MGTNDKRDATFHPGQAPVYGHTPLDWMAGHGAVVPPEPDPAVDREHYASPGEPPPSWPRYDRPTGRRGLPAWAWVSIVLGGLFLICGSSAAVALWDESGPTPAVSTVPPTSPVSVTGTCEKRIVGEYGLVATVRATNATDKPQTGAVWVRWPITGEAAQEFPKLVTLAPGESVEHVVNEDVKAERWLRMGACSYGWTKTG
jgi:hypothetical protein